MVRRMSVELEEQTNIDELVRELEIVKLERDKYADKLREIYSNFKDISDTASRLSSLATFLGVDIVNIPKELKDSNNEAR